MSDPKEQKQAPAVELDPAAAAKKAAKDAKNEEKRLAKMAKFAAKQAKVWQIKKITTSSRLLKQTNIAWRGQKDSWWQCNQWKEKEEGCQGRTCTCIRQQDTQGWKERYSLLFIMTHTKTKHDY